MSRLKFLLADRQLTEVNLFLKDMRLLVEALRNCHKHLTENEVHELATQIQNDLAVRFPNYPEYDKNMRLTISKISTQITLTASDDKLPAPSTTSRHEPPAVAEFVLRLVSNPARYEFTAGCITEVFESEVRKYGLTRARRLY